MEEVRKKLQEFLREANELKEKLKKFNAYQYFSTEELLKDWRGEEKTDKIQYNVGWAEEPLHETIYYLKKALEIAQN
jgi:predicted nuclease with TOPRIM domain